MNERCDDCVFTYEPTSGRAAAHAITLEAEELAAMVESGSDELLLRPAPDTWSVLEYCCHVRDVLLVQRERVLLARRTLRPSLMPMGRDERVEHEVHHHLADVRKQISD